MYTRIDQDAVILARAARKTSAATFTSWLRGNPDARAAIKAAGYPTSD